MSERLKILYIPLWFPDEEKRDFSGIFNLEHVKAVSPFVDIQVLHFINDTRSRIPQISMRKIAMEGITIFKVTTGLSPIPKTSFVSWSINLYRAIHAIIKKTGRPDLIHAQDQNAWMVGWFATRHHIPFVISQHWSKVLDGRLSFIEKKQYAWAFKSAQRVLPVHYDAANKYTQRAWRASVEWLPNTYDPEVFFNKMSKKQANLLHISGFAPQKRINDIIDAFALVVSSHPGACLIFIGDGPGRQSAEKWASKLLPKGSFSFIGFLNKRDIADQLSTAKGLLLPSEFETFGCVLMEAMACGCPVLTTRVGGIPGVVQNNDEGILVDVGNSLQIKEGMISMLDETHGLDLNEIAKKTQKTFSSPNIGLKMKQIYQSAIMEYKSE